MPTLIAAIRFLRLHWSEIASVVSAGLAVFLPDQPAVVTNILQILAALFGSNVVLRVAVREHALQTAKMLAAHSVAVAHRDRRTEADA